ncbi:FliA/WhiG family RNA polymerase sigma factor [Photobacterium sp. ZSDE20]|uniref:FliA/WhiG family RNA polymerase sigma factor n=1 Tax=Photobacterium pectinilyticum TaxID=2906793 RepID=A0ABT1N2F6_9GAMM|nr:FliA/WhiG family RNA polymerase sigma factor [Photobacterium sp. ZSDE20]MCQ1057444.1 FliA/WhiG family RNA polymerase sigma factor [Photobacterium sp. ZSDE20]MDD1821607.1 FliA/WhiG family RNA polymerase sigma factor [Photobacterium sp. ZSDE20]
MLEAQQLPFEDEYAQWQTKPSQNNEEQVLRQHLKLVKRIVQQLHHHASGCMGLDDMEQIGLLGLLEATRRYGEMDENFRFFAARRVRGAILDELRRRDWRPRQLRQQVHELNKVSKLLTKQLKRHPNEHELAKAMQISLEECHRLLYAAQAEELYSLEQLFESDSSSVDFGQSDSNLQHLINDDLLKHVLSQLPKREQLILDFYYQKELSLKEIAIVVGLSEARICQLHKQAIKQMNAMIKSVM